MNVLIFTASPNVDGLTAACGDAAMRGIVSAGHEGIKIDLCKRDIGNCRACGNGWGTCLLKQRCTGIVDDFTAIQDQVRDADAYIFVTPVYYGEMSERLKAFCDRLRRCEAPRKGEGALVGKPCLMVAAAGGSGGGTISCLDAMQRFSQHVGMRHFDLIPITRRSRTYQLAAIEVAAAAMTAYGEAGRK